MNNTLPETTAIKMIEWLKVPLHKLRRGSRLILAQPREEPFPNKPRNKSNKYDTKNNTQCQSNPSILWRSWWFFWFVCALGITSIRPEITSFGWLNTNKTIAVGNVSKFRLWNRWFSSVRVYHECLRGRSYINLITKGQWKIRIEGSKCLWLTELQFGPRDPIKDVFPNSSFPVTVKFFAELMAIPYPNAPEKWLLITVAFSLLLFPYRSPNHVLGPIAIPILSIEVQCMSYRKVLENVSILLDNSREYIISFGLTVFVTVSRKATKNRIILDNYTSVITGPRTKIYKIDSTE